MGCPTIADFLLDDFIPLSSGTTNNNKYDESKSKPTSAPDSVIEDPWKCSDSHLKGLTLTEKIHEEMVRFCEYISPTPEEHSAREDLIDRIRSLITSLFTSAEVLVFGSVATRLYLPVSDLDIVVRIDHDDGKGCLRQIAQALQAHNMASFIEQILSARVPIVKFTDRLTGISVDICCNVESGLEACNLIDTFQQEMPALRPLTFFLKYFLQFRQMNETYCGGLGSFVLQMMIISHLQLHPFGQLKRLGKRVHRDLNLGALLLSFFELYGKTLNYAVVGISVRDGGSYFNKAQRGFADPGRPYLLSVENPLEPTLDVGRNSFGMMRIRRSFAWAYDRLTLDFPDESSTSLLGRLISVRGEPFRIRSSVQIHTTPVVLQKEPDSEKDLLFCPPEEEVNTKKRKKSKKENKFKSSKNKKQHRKGKSEIVCPETNKTSSRSPIRMRLRKKI